jgi:predicted nucleic acid binding AN1-type Zn finger protein
MLIFTYFVKILKPYFAQFLIFAIVFLFTKKHGFIMFGRNKKDGAMDIEKWEKTFLKTKRKSNKFLEIIRYIQYPYRYCSICKKELATTERYKCHFCNKNFCSEHKLTQDHKCRGKFNIAIGGHETHSAGGKISAD